MGVLLQLFKGNQIYRVFIKYCFFPLKCCDFSELCKFCCKRWGLTCHCVNRERHESGIYFKIFEKTQYLINTLYICRLPNITGPLCSCYSIHMNNSGKDYQSACMCRFECTPRPGTSGSTPTGSRYTNNVAYCFSMKFASFVSNLFIVYTGNRSFKK